MTTDFLQEKLSSVPRLRTDVPKLKVFGTPAHFSWRTKGRVPYIRYKFGLAKAECCLTPFEGLDFFKQYWSWVYNEGHFVFHKISSNPVHARSFYMIRSEDMCLA